MTSINIIYGIFPLACVVFALVSRRSWMRTAIALLLFAYLFLTCTFGLDAIGREVAMQAQKNGEFSSGFVLGLTRLNDAFLKSRVLLVIIGFCLLLLALFPHTEGRGNSQNESSTQK